jgi:phytoene synthase
MPALDPDYINRAAPPGSLRYFALLYTPVDQRDLLTSLFVIETEIRASIHAAHEVAHTRLQWWRGEIDRLVNRNAQHPATKVLQSSLPNADFAILHELIVAADMDMARMTYNNAAELNAYLERSGGVVLQIAAQRDDQDVRKAGALIRRVETLRDLSLDARAGRIYWPLDELDARKIELDQLRGERSSDAVRALIAAEVARLHSEFGALNTTLRPVRVLTELHAKLLRRIERANHDVFTQRHELGPLEKVWTAWRAARRF